MRCYFLKQEGGSQFEGEDKENVDHDNRNPRRRQFRRFNNRRRRQASNRSEDGGEEGGWSTAVANKAISYKSILSVGKNMS